MALRIRDKATGRFLPLNTRRRNIHVERDGTRLYGERARSARRRAVKRRRPPPSRRPPKPPALPRHTRSPQYRSPFRHFLENVERRRPSEVVTVFVIASRTSARYETRDNRTGTRHIPVSLGDMTAGKAAALTIHDVNMELRATGQRYDRDRAGNYKVLGLYALIGKARTRTHPAKGDRKRKRKAKRHLGR